MEQSELRARPSILEEGLKWDTSMPTEVWSGQYWLKMPRHRQTDDCEEYDRACWSLWVKKKDPGDKKTRTVYWSSNDVERRCHLSSSVANRLIAGVARGPWVYNRRHDKSYDARQTWRSLQGLAAQRRSSEGSQLADQNMMPRGHLPEISVFSLG